jgi:predicted MPP superfamily phosphohydrolase
MVFLKYVLILGVLLILPDIYIYCCYIVPSKISKWWRRCYWLPAVLLILALLSFMLYPVRTGTTIVRVVATLMFVIIFGKLSFACVSVIGRLIGIRFPRIRKVFDCFALALCGVTVACVLYSFLYGYRQYRVRQVSIYSKEIPRAFDGYRIVQFSDLHVGSFIKGKDKNVQRIVDLINEQKGNLIVFTGDLVNRSADEVDGFEPILSQLKASDGVYSIMGNHDYGKYRQWSSPLAETDNLNRLKQKERSFGWRLLLNQNVMLHRGDSCVALIGAEDYGDRKDYRYGDLKKSLAGLPNGGHGLYKILLEHDPSYWHMKVLPESDVQLMLSGHTHGMQLKIGSFSPSQWLFTEWGGLYAVNRRMLYVSMGVGGLMPFRFGAWPEITVITLRR